MAVLCKSLQNLDEEVVMAAYLLILVAVLTRVIPHAGWWNFTALTGGLLYFGARRSWREMFAPLVAVMATDYFLTVYTYHYPFHWRGYVVTWAWDLGAIALGWALLHTRTTFLRATLATILGPTSFFIIVDFAVWVGSSLYPHTLQGLIACYVAAIPFYGNDLVSTAIVLGAVLGVPALVRQMRRVQAQEALAGK
jgi:hypothetical protein